MLNINELNPDNSALALIDHQPFVAFSVESHDRAAIVRNTVALAAAAKALEIPTVLTTISAQGGPLADPLLGALSEVFPDAEPIDRTNTNAWSDERFVEAVAATGRAKLVMAGLWTEVCLAQTALSAIKDGYEVYFVSDASGGVSREAHDDAKARMVQAGARPLTWMAAIAEWCPDNSSPEYQRMYEVVVRHGGGTGQGVEYVLAQMQSGRVAAPGAAPGGPGR